MTIHVNQLLSLAPACSISPHVVLVRTSGQRGMGAAMGSGTDGK
jgi:hypothetical protein